MSTQDLITDLAAPLIKAVGPPGPPGVSSGFLDDTTLYPNVSGSVCGQIAPGVAASIDNNSPVSETFANLIASPADGTSQTENDFHNGAAATTDGDELALSGTAGTNTNFLSGDGSADFAILKSLGANSVIKSWHRSDIGKGWMTFAFRFDANAQQDLISNRELTSDLGVSLIVTGSNGLRLTVSNGTNVLNASFSATLTDNTDFLLIVSWDGSITSNNIKLWVNSDTATETISGTFRTSTTDSTELMAIFANNAPTRFLGPDTRGYGHDWGNDFIGNTEAAEIRDWYQLNTPIT